MAVLEIGMPVILNVWNPATETHDKVTGTVNQVHSGANSFHTRINVKIDDSPTVTNILNQEQIKTYHGMDYWQQVEGN